MGAELNSPKSQAQNVANRDQVTDVSNVEVSGDELDSLLNQVAEVEEKKALEFQNDKDIEISDRKK